MTSIDKKQISVLVNLESIENERRLIQAKLAAVADKYAALEAELEAARETVTGAETDLGAMKKAYREAESELKISQSKVKASQEKLRSVKNNKEYQSLLKEIADLERVGSGHEDVILESLESIDSVENIVAEQKKAYIQLEREIEAQKKQIGAEEDQNRSCIAQLEQKFTEISAKIDERLVQTYNTVKTKQAGGGAIVSVKDAVCNGCHLNIPPQMYNELQRCDSLTFCPHCQRIIYWEGMGDTA